MTTTAQSNGRPWKTYCRDLAEWSWHRLAVKRDRHGLYAADGSAAWTFSEVTRDDLAAHFAGEFTMGLGATSLDDECLWVAWDIDNHQTDETTSTNLDYALILLNRLVEMGFSPLLEDSDGKGGIHLWVLFTDPIPATKAFAFARDVAHDFADHVPKIECFPKNSTVRNTPAKCGTYLRTPGKHHKRTHWSRFWGESEWLDCLDSVELLLSHVGDDPALIPEPKRQNLNGFSARQPHEWRSADAVIERARKYLQRVPGALSGSGGHGRTFYASCRLVKGFSLSADQSFDLLSEWNTTCVPPWTEVELRHKITDAAKASGPSGYLRDSKPERWDAIDAEHGHKPDAKTGSGTAEPRTFAGIDAADLELFSTLEPDWLVEDIFTSDEPLLVGARSKCCKTLQSIDLAVALATGTPWMGVFHVPRRRKVLFISGETNQRRMAKHISRACRARGLTFADLRGWLHVETMIFPILPDAADRDSIHHDIQKHGFEVAICDPLYRGLCGIDSHRLNEVGSAIKLFQEACAPACLMLSHHVVKTAAREYGEPPSLEDMTGAGIAESCGQWWLVGRNEKYAWNWQHDLCVQYGGREGQAGGKRILFNEAAWSFQVDSLHEYRELTQSDADQRRDDVRRDCQDRKRASARAQIQAAVMNIHTPQSKASIEAAAGAVQSDFRVVFGEMTREQTLIQRPYRDARNRLQAGGFIHRDYVKAFDSEASKEMLVVPRCSSLTSINEHLNE